MSGPVPRPYSDSADLRAMQVLAQSLWCLESRFHIGDLAWQRFEHEGREPDWPTMLWEENGAVIGWGWAHLSDGHLYLMAPPDRTELVSEILDWFEQTVPAVSLSVAVLDKETHFSDALTARGYRAAPGGAFDLHTVLDLDQLPDKPVLMPGLSAHSMASSGDAERRAAAHRAAWHPSRVTTQSYRNVMAAWPYRPDLDWVVAVADGRFVANCCLWLDEMNSVALLEPVGVDPGYRRLGLGRAVCLHALHRLRELGCARAVTYPRGDAAYAIPKKMYLGMGFESYARTRLFVRHR